jgi:hypothetical protein
MLVCPFIQLTPGPGDSPPEFAVYWVLGNMEGEGKIDEL